MLSARAGCRSPLGHNFLRAAAPARTPCPSRHCSTPQREGAPGEAGPRLPGLGSVRISAPAGSAGQPGPGLCCVAYGCEQDNGLSLEGACSERAALPGALLPKPPCLPRCLPLPSGGPQQREVPGAGCPRVPRGALAEADAPLGPAQLPSPGREGPSPGRSAGGDPVLCSTGGAGEGAGVRRAVGETWPRAQLPASRSLAAPPQQHKMGKEDEEARGLHKDKEAAHRVLSRATQAQRGKSHLGSEEQNAH